MREETKRKLALCAVVLYAMAPVLLFGISGIRVRIIWGVPGVPLPWPVPIPIILPTVTPEA